MIACIRCGRGFHNKRSLSQHQRHEDHPRPASDRQLDEQIAAESRAKQVREVRLMARLGLMGRHP